MNRIRTRPTTRRGRMLLAAVMALLGALPGLGIGTVLNGGFDASSLGGAVVFVAIFVVIAWRGERNA
jgi:hypothetical protein